MDNKRFDMIKQKSSLAEDVLIVVDKATGVNYLCVQRGYTGGLTPLLGRDGKPVITPV